MGADKLTLIPSSPKTASLSVWMDGDGHAAAYGPAGHLVVAMLLSNSPCRLASVGDVARCTAAFVRVAEERLARKHLVCGLSWML